MTYDDVVLTDDVAAFDWTNDVTLTAYVVLTDDVTLTDDVSQSYWTKMIMWR